MGSLPFMQKIDAESLEYPYRVMHRLSEIHGNTMRVGLGSDVWIILTGLEEIKEFTMMDETTFRPDLTVLNEIYSFGKEAQGINTIMNLLIYI